MSLQEAKRHVRAEDFADDDAYLQSLIDTATAYVDGPEPAWLGRSIAQQGWQLLLDRFPCGAIRLPLPPLQEVTSVEYVDLDGVTQTLAGFREFGVDSLNSDGIVLPAFDTEWPSARNEPEAVRISFTAGYSSVPKAVKHAILLLVGEWYENREDASELKLTEIPTAACSLLMPLRFWPS